MLKLNLKQIAKERQIENLYRWLVKIGLTPKIAARWGRGEPKRLDLFYLEMVCTSLKCKPNDILEWVPDEEQKDYPESHPLSDLKKKPEVTDVKFVLRTLPKEQLDELLAEIKKRQDGLTGPNAKFQGVDYEEDTRRLRKRRS
jgi:DNA-binding Xre family transcriptional regulator